MRPKRCPQAADIVSQNLSRPKRFTVTLDAKRVIIVRRRCTGTASLRKHAVRRCPSRPIVLHCRTNKTPECCTATNVSEEWHSSLLDAVSSDQGFCRSWPTVQRPRAPVTCLTAPLVQVRTAFPYMQHLSRLTTFSNTSDTRLPEPGARAAASPGERAAKWGLFLQFRNRVLKQRVPAKLANIPGSPPVTCTTLIRHVRYPNPQHHLVLHFAAWPRSY
jgi:hypothetical protein